MSGFLSGDNAKYAIAGVAVGALAHMALTTGAKAEKKARKTYTQDGRLKLVLSPHV